RAPRWAQRSVPDNDRGRAAARGPGPRRRTRRLGRGPDAARTRALASRTRTAASRGAGARGAPSSTTLALQGGDPFVHAAAESFRRSHGSPRARHAPRPTGALTSWRQDPQRSSHAPSTPTPSRGADRLEHGAEEILLGHGPLELHAVVDADLRHAHDLVRARQLGELGGL